MTDLRLFAVPERVCSTTDEVLAIGEWAGNAALIADVARLGYLDGTVLDATYGEGAFWNDWRPEDFTSNDRHKPADHGYSYREFPSEWEGSFDAVVFDPPYKLQGTPRLGKFDDAYGISGRVRDTPDDFDLWYGVGLSVPWPERMEDIRLGALECFRVTRRFLLVKCQDQIASGQARWQTDMVTRAIEDAGGRKVDRFELTTTPRPQPGARRQLHARRNHSTLLVFERGR